MPKLPLTRRKIVAAAIEMADEGELAAVSLRGIASRLGVHVTSLYNHVPTKEAVLNEMVRTLLAEAKLPMGTLSWQDWVRQFATAMRALARRHPGAFEAFHRVPAQGERAAESFEAALAAFRAGGFDMPSALNAVKSTSVAVLGLVLDDVARLRHPGRRTDLGELPVERFPHIHEANRFTEIVDTFPYIIDTLIEGFGRNRQAATPASATNVRRRSRPRTAAR